jgi:hypothetical protein
MKLGSATVRAFQLITVATPLTASHLYKPYLVDLNAGSRARRMEDRARAVDHYLVYGTETGVGTQPVRHFDLGEGQVPGGGAVYLNVFLVRITDGLARDRAK